MLNYRPLLNTCKNAIMFCGAEEERRNLVTCRFWHCFAAHPKVRLRNSASSVTLLPTFHSYNPLNVAVNALSYDLPRREIMYVFVYSVRYPCLELNRIDMLANLINLPLLHFIKIISYFKQVVLNQCTARIWNGHLPEWGNTESEWLHWMKYGNYPNGRINISLRKQLQSPVVNYNIIKLCT